VKYKGDQTSKTAKSYWEGKKSEGRIQEVAAMSLTPRDILRWCHHLFKSIESPVCQEKSQGDSKGAGLILKTSSLAKRES